MFSLQTCPFLQRDRNDLNAKSAGACYAQKKEERKEETKGDGNPSYEDKGKGKGKGKEEEKRRANSEG